MSAAKTVWTVIVWSLGLGPIGKLVYMNTSYSVLQKLRSHQKRL
jgi:hypothetical protein